MSKHTCNDCHTSIPRGQEVKRTTSLFDRSALLVKCRPCAEDAGWIDFPAPRGPLSVEVESAAARGVAAAEAYANGARR